MGATGKKDRPMEHPRGGEIGAETGGSGDLSNAVDTPVWLPDDVMRAGHPEVSFHFSTWCRIAARLTRSFAGGSRLPPAKRTHPSGEDLEKGVVMSENMYEGFTAQVYDQIPIYQARQDVDFYVDEARQAGGEVLELGAGTGRILMPVARAGTTVTGMDDAEAALARCRAKLETESRDLQKRVTLVQGDLRDFALGKTFALITAPFRVFQHLMTVADQMAALGAIERHLAPGGRLILDFFNPNYSILSQDATGEEQGHEPEFTMPDGRRVVRCFRVLDRDRSTQSMRLEFVYHVVETDGTKRRIAEGFDMRWFHRYEIDHLLARCGFVTETIYGDFDRRPFDNKHPAEMIILARRAE